ncbi:MAG: SMP-30/gluconolactonase/LRE family protein [Bacteroidota bacterium]
MSKHIYWFFIFYTAALLPAQEVSTLIPVEAGIGYEAINWNVDNGRILIPDFTNNQVHEIFLDGTRQVLIDSIGDPLGGAWDQAGNFYVSEYRGVGKIWMLTPSGETSIIATGMGGPAGLLVDSAQQILYVADYDNSLIRRVFLSNGTSDVFVQGQGLNGPDAIIYAPNGDLIVNNFNDNKIFRITTSGQISLYTTLFGSPNSGYLVRRGESYYVGGFFSNSIWRIDEDGVATVWSGSTSPGNVDGHISEARFNRPNGMGISADGDSILVSDGNLNPRIRLITGINGSISSNRNPIESHDFKLSVSPNPASDYLNVAYELSESSPVKLSIFDMQGQQVSTLVDSLQARGAQEVRWQIPADLTPAYYQCVLESGPWKAVSVLAITPN